MADNKGFEDITDNKSDTSADSESAENESSESEEVESEEVESEEVESTGEVDDDSANQLESLNATIAILQTEASLKDAEIERWKSINLQMLLSMPAESSDDSVELESSEEDDPEPYKDESGAARLFTTK